jgi:hypothetical protein
MTATTLIYGALRLLGVLRPGMGANTSSLTDGRDILNDLLETWSIEPLTVYTVAPQTFPLTPGKQTYTFGTGGDFNAKKPDVIEHANLIYQPGSSPALHLPLEILTRAKWEEVRLQAIASPIPTAIYPDSGNPLTSISFLPYPSAACSVELYTWQAFSAFADLTTAVVMPTGYPRALKYNLAVDMAPAFSISAKTNPLYAQIEEIAKSSKAAIQNLNLPAPVMACDPAIARQRTGAGRPSYLTGWY